MARSIKQIAHDLTPSIEMINKISETVVECLSEMETDLKIKDTELEDCYHHSLDGIKSLESFAKLMLAYINEVNLEADREGIPKTYEYKPGKK